MAVRGLRGPTTPTIDQYKPFRGKFDAFCGFVRGTRRKSKELGVVSVEMGAFTSQFSTTSWEKFFIGPPLWLSPDRCNQILPKQPGYIRVKPVFLSGQKPQREAPGR